MITIELINPKLPRGHIRHALFDFDGTLSLIRQGWQQVMIPLLVEILQALDTGESEAALTTEVTEFVDRLTGKQTIYQMEALCDAVRRRGHEPRPPLAYKRVYLERLARHIADRIAALRAGTATPEDYAVPGGLAFVRALRARGVTCYLASGTDQADVRAEAALLGIDDCFAGIYGALDGDMSTSKRVILERIVRENALGGAELVTFGDGFVEIEETKAVGGIAVGVATDEVRREGVDAWKRARLIRAGADLIIADFRDHGRLLSYLFAEE